MNILHKQIILINFILLFLSFNLFFSSFPLFIPNPTPPHQHSLSATILPHLQCSTASPHFIATLFSRQYIIAPLHHYIVAPPYHHITTPLYRRIIAPLHCYAWRSNCCEGCQIFSLDSFFMKDLRVLGDVFAKIYIMNFKSLGIQVPHPIPSSICIFPKLGYLKFSLLNLYILRNFRFPFLLRWNGRLWFFCQIERMSENVVANVATTMNSTTHCSTLLFLFLFLFYDIFLDIVLAL